MGGPKGLVTRVPGVLNSLISSFMVPAMTPNPLPPVASPMFYKRKLSEAVEKQVDDLVRLNPKANAGIAHYKDIYLGTAQKIPQAMFMKNTPEGLIAYRNSAMIGPVGKKIESELLEDRLKTLRSDINAVVKKHWDKADDLADDLILAQNAGLKKEQILPEWRNVIKSKPEFEQIVQDRINTEASPLMDQVEEARRMAAMTLGNTMPGVSPRLPAVNLDTRVATPIIRDVEKAVGTKFDDLTIGAPSGFFASGGGSRELGTGKVVVTTLNPTVMAHELSHNLEAQKWYVDPLRVGGNVASTMLMYGTPLSIAFGDKIKNAIPGSFDDKAVDFLRDYGPEAFLALRFGTQIVPEHFAHRNSIRATAQGKLWEDDNLKHLLKGVNLTPEDAFEQSKLRSFNAFSTYPLLSVGTPYAALKGYQLYDKYKRKDEKEKKKEMPKQSSAYTYAPATGYGSRLFGNTVSTAKQQMTGYKDTLKALFSPSVLWEHSLYNSPTGSSIFNRHNLLTAGYLASPLLAYYGLSALLKGDHELKDQMSNVLPYQTMVKVVAPKISGINEI